MSEGLYGLIGAIISTIIISIVDLLKKKNNKHVIESQLLNVFEPLFKKTILSPNLSNNHWRKLYKNIVIPHYSLVPLNLREKFISLEKDLFENSETKYSICVINESYYHWACRHLGFPFDRKKIITSDIYVYVNRSNFVSILKDTLICTSIVIAIFIIFIILLLTARGKNVPAILVNIVSIIIGVLIPLAFFSGMTKIQENLNAFIERRQRKKK